VDTDYEQKITMNWILTLPILVFMVSFFVLPIGNLFLLSSSVVTENIFQDPYFNHVLRFTYLQAAYSAFLSVGFGFVAAFLIKEWRIFGGNLLWSLGLLFSSLPSIVVALGLLGSWGPSIGFGWTGILIGHLFLNFGIPMRLIGVALQDRNRTPELLANSLGMNKRRVFFKITLPQLKSSLMASWILSFLYSSTSLFIVMFLGGGPRFTTLEVLLYEAVKLNLNTPKAIQIASLQALIGGLLFLCYYRMQKRRVQEGQQPRVNLFLMEKNWVRVSVSLVFWIITFSVLGIPLVFILKDAVWDWSSNFTSSLLHATASSLKIGLCVVVLGNCILYPFLHYIYREKGNLLRSGSVWLVILPQFFSGAVVAFALSVFYPSLRGNDEWGILGVVLTQTLFAIPLMYFALNEGFERMAQERFWIAQSLGANRWQRFFHVELPGMRRPLLLSMLIGFGFSLGEVVSLLLFAPAHLQTLSLTLFQAMSRYRFQEAHAATGVLLVMIVILFLIMGSLEEKDGSGQN